MDVNIGKTITLQVNVNDLPANALEHVIYIGLRNVLMDSHASVTKETNPDDIVAVARAMAEKKLAALMSGDVRVTSTRERVGDPVKVEAIRIAMAPAKTALVKAGNAKPDGKAIRAKAILLVSANPAYMSLAQKHIDEAKALGLDAVDDIDVDEPTDEPEAA